MLNSKISSNSRGDAASQKPRILFDSQQSDNWLASSKSSALLKKEQAKPAGDAHEEIGAGLGGQERRPSQKASPAKSKGKTSSDSEDMTPSTPAVPLDATTPDIMNKVPQPTTSLL